MNRVPIRGFFFFISCELPILFFLLVLKGERQPGLASALRGETGRRTGPLLVRRSFLFFLPRRPQRHSITFTGTPRCYSLLRRPAYFSAILLRPAKLNWQLVLAFAFPVLAVARTPQPTQRQLLIPGSPRPFFRRPGILQDTSAPRDPRVDSRLLSSRLVLLLPPPSPCLPSAAHPERRSPSHDMTSHTPPIMALNDLRPPTSSLAARREAPPLSLINTARERPAPAPVPAKTSFDDSLLQVSTPAFFNTISPGHPPKIAASPRAPPPVTSAARPALRPSKSFTNAKLSGKSSFLDLFSKPKAESARGYSEQTQTPSRKSLGARPPPTVQEPPPALPNSQQRPKTRDRSVGVTRAAMASATALDEPVVVPASPTESAVTPPPLSHVHVHAVAHAALEDAEPYRVSKSKRKGTPVARAAPSRPTTGYKKSIAPEQRRSSDAHGIPSEAPAHDGVHRKIFVLAATGHVHEYAGMGLADRRPLRTIQLGASSAAFASDAIPGKHWVLQIVPSTEDSYSNKAGLAPRKSLVRRLFSSSSSSTTSQTKPMFLIFESPTDMNHWIVAVREQVSRSLDRSDRPRTAIKKGDSADLSPQVTVTKPDESPSVPRLPSPPAQAGAQDPMMQESELVKPPSPTIKAPLPASPTTLVGSERLSRADTAVGTASNASSCRSSHAAGKGSVEAIRPAPSPIPERPSVEQGQSEPEDEVTMESPATHVSQPSLSFDSSAAASHVSTANSTPMEEHDQDAIFASATSHQFYTPLSTPVTWNFPRDKAKRVSTYASVDKLNGQSDESVTGARAGLHALRTSQSAPRLATNVSTSSMETIRESSQYFKRRNPDPIEEVNETPRSPLGNAFAQAAERREQQSGKAQSPSGSVSLNSVTSRGSPVQARTSPRTSTPGSSANTSKRTSIIHSNAPLPLRTSQVFDTASSAKSSRDLQGLAPPLEKELRDAPIQGGSTTPDSALHRLAGDAIPRPESGSGAPKLKRPSSLRVQADFSLLPSTARPAQAASQSASPQSATEKPRTTPPSSGRSSTLVPVVRPPSVRPQHITRGVRQVRAGSISTKPPSAPPNIPLPPPPGQMPMSMRTSR